MNEWDITINALKDHGKFMFAGAALGLVTAFLFLIIQSPIYEARLTVAPTERTGVPSLGTMLPQAMTETPMLRYFVDRIDASTATDFNVFEALIDSPRLAQHLVESKSFALPADTIPEMTRWLDEHIRIRPVGTSPFRQITLRTHHPDIALRLLGLIYQETDMMIRQDTNMRTQRRLAYLKEQLKNTRHPDHRDAIVALMREQEQTAMMVSIDHHFAAQPIDGPSLKPDPVAPNWRLLVPGLMVGGIIMGFIISGLRQAWRHK